MYKAVIVGGSNGIGLSIAIQLSKMGYAPIIVDRTAPPAGTFSSEQMTFVQMDLTAFNEDPFIAWSQDHDVKLLMITAGYGWVADFECMHTKQIEQMIEVNTIAALKIVRIFYERIKSEEHFCCGIMGSIAGLCSSPMFSVYAASKAALCRFTESVNIELEAAGVSNRILNVSPGSIKGTRFNGGANDLTQITDLTAQIINALQSSETLLIPNYDTVFKGVLERYHDDPHSFGLSSYEYKQNSGRVSEGRHLVVGYLSGTFDLFHIGHLNLLKRAKAQCDYLVVGVHPNAAHKGKEAFIPFEERKEIVAACRYVDKVVPSCTEDSDAWELYHYNKLFVGSDYKGTERFMRYEKYFEDKGVEIVYFPYTKGTSSTQLRDCITNQTNS